LQLNFIEAPVSTVISKAMSTVVLPGNFLVQGNRSDVAATPLLISSVGLSFWGGIDPLTGIVVDTSHPLHGICVANTIVCLPSGRGSSTASQVLLELILNDKAPRAFCFRDVDGMACVGAIIAKEVFANDGAKNIQIPDMIHIGQEAYQELLQIQASKSHGCVLPNGDFVVGDSSRAVETELKQWTQDHRNDDLPGPSYTAEEQAMLDSCTSDAQRMAYRVMFEYAHLGIDPNDATARQPTYLDITQAHIDGCTYIGPGGLEYAQRLGRAQGQVQVPTTLNSGSADRRMHQHLGVPPTYAANAVALGDAYLALGCTPSFTCAPYLLSTEPKLGDQIAWGESNAVVFANSVLGAKTEKYADYLDICCALTGKIPAMGVHLDDNRKPQIVLDATEMLRDLLQAMDNNDNDNVAINLEMLFPTLGHACGSLSDGKVPVLVGFEKDPKWASLVTKDHLKAFCAAYGTTGSSPLVHIEGVTPETIQDPNLTIHARQNSVSKTVTWSHCEETFALLNNSSSSSSINAETKPTKIDLVALGNPHLSVQECQDLVTLIQSLSSSSSLSQPLTKHPNVRIMACLSREIHSQADAQGHIDVLKDFGVEFINDTCWCMLLDPPVIPPDANAIILTNSGKYAHYGPGLTNRKFRYGSTVECVLTATTGEYPSTFFSNNNSTGTTPASPKGIPHWLTMTVPSLQQRQSRSFSTLTSQRDWSQRSQSGSACVPASLARARSVHFESSMNTTARSMGCFALQILRKLKK